MGKHEREDIELMEKSVVNVLMGEKPLIDQEHKWYEHMREFVKYIRGHYPNFIRVEHIGNKYGGYYGDIKILTAKRRSEFIELKASGSAYGKGTLANISQNALTDYGLIYSEKGEEILSWSEFRGGRKFQGKVENMLYKYSYPKRLVVEEEGRYIRDRAKEGDAEAMVIKEEISGLAKRDKREYINYIRRFRVDEEKVKKFIFCMLNGIHTKKEILDVFRGVSVDGLKDKYEYITTLYGNVRNGRVVITRGESRIKMLLKNYNRFGFSFPRETGGVVNTYIICHEKTSGKMIKVINLVYHWKNVFQGIQTPCINVFLGSFFRLEK